MDKIDIEKISEGNHKAYSELIETLEKVKDAIKKQNYGIAMDILCKPYPAFQVITLSSESKDEPNVVVVIPKFRVGDVIRHKGSTAEYTIESISGECYHGKGWGLHISCDDDYELVEQKPADKVEPKFHEGEWVILTAGELSTTLQIVKVDTNKKLYWFNDSSYLPIVDEECLHLWSIQDAKDGDILCSNQIIVLFKQWEDNTDYSFVIAHAGIDVSGKLQVTNGHWLISNKSKPATKEQCDLLFQKMKEAGYEWDADAKVLKEIEQKSAEWTKEDIQMYRNILSYLAEPSPLKEVNGKSREQLLDWFKGFKDRYTWKPSDAQMIVLNDIIINGHLSNANERILKGLHKQLKKLREE